MLLNSAVGVYSFDGAHEEWKKVRTLTDKLRQRWTSERPMRERQREKLREEEERQRIQKQKVANMTNDSEAGRGNTARNTAISLQGATTTKPTATTALATSKAGVTSATLNASAKAFVPWAVK